MTKKFALSAVLGIFFCSSVNAQPIPPPDLVIVGSKEETTAVLSDLNNSGAQVYSLNMPGELPNNLIDDNNDGFIDNVYGWNGSEAYPLEPVNLKGDTPRVGVYVIQVGNNLTPRAIVDLINFSGIRKVVIRDKVVRENVLADLANHPPLDVFNKKKSLSITIIEL